MFAPIGIRDDARGRVGPALGGRVRVRGLGALHERGARAARDGAVRAFVVIAWQVVATRAAMGLVGNEGDDGREHLVDGQVCGVCDRLHEGRRGEDHVRERGAGRACGDGLHEGRDSVGGTDGKGAHDAAGRVVFHDGLTNVVVAEPL